MPETERATLDELKEFANKVREAGGGNPLDALMPAVPTNPSQCLIARNLNFNCTVWCENGEYDTDQDNWIMVVDDEETRDAIADKLGLERVSWIAPPFKTSLPERFAVLLPAEIGQVAEDFDRAGDWFYDIQAEVDNSSDEFSREGDDFPEPSAQEIVRSYLTDELSVDQRIQLREMAPYIEASKQEAYNLATAINEKGEIIL